MALESKYLIICFRDLCDKKIWFIQVIWLLPPVFFLQKYNNNNEKPRVLSRGITQHVTLTSTEMLMSVIIPHLPQIPTVFSSPSPQFISVSAPYNLPSRPFTTPSPSPTLCICLTVVWVVGKIIRYYELWRILLHGFGAHLNTNHSSSFCTLITRWNLDFKIQLLHFYSKMWKVGNGCAVMCMHQ